MDTRLALATVRSVLRSNRVNVSALADLVQYCSGDPLQPGVSACLDSLTATAERLAAIESALEARPQSPVEMPPAIRYARRGRRQRDEL